MKSLFQKMIIAGLLLLFVACGSDSSSSSKASSSASSSTTSVFSSSVSSQVPNAVLSGLVTYDFIPHAIDHIGLDYQNIQTKPARGVSIELLDELGNLLSTSQTDREGRFEFQVTQNQLLKIRVTARLQSFAPSWDISVKDNTQQNLPYAIEGQIKAVESASESRHLHVASGWNGSAYTETRSAAPFAILDTIYTGLERLQLAGLTQNLPALNIYWSEKNTTAEGNIALGEIGTSYFSQDAIYLLGDANVDTDEYDAHVILHEWTHYLETVLSRADSIGGNHHPLDKLDMRLAFSEGFANAFSGMMLDDPFYKDALGISQNNGFFIDLGNQSQTIRGWYSQGSIATIFYNYYLSSFNRTENTMQDIFSVITREDYINSSYFLTIFSFSEFLQKQVPAAFPTWSMLLTEQNINSALASAEGEINAGGYAENLPVYKNLSIANPAITACSSNRFGSINHLSNFQFAKVSIQEPATYKLQAIISNQNMVGNPDLYLFSRGTLVSSAKTNETNQEAMQLFLLPNEYMLVIADADVANTISNSDITHCFQVTLSAEQGQ